MRQSLVSLFPHITKSTDTSIANTTMNNKLYYHVIHHYYTQWFLLKPLNPSWIYHTFSAITTLLATHWHFLIFTTIKKCHFHYYLSLKSIILCHSCYFHRNNHWTIQQKWFYKDVLTITSSTILSRKHSLLFTVTFIISTTITTIINFFFHYQHHKTS